MVICMLYMVIHGYYFIIIIAYIPIKVQRYKK